MRFGAEEAEDRSGVAAMVLLKMMRIASVNMAGVDTGHIKFRRRREWETTKNKQKCGGKSEKIE